MVVCPCLFFHNKFVCVAITNPMGSNAWHCGVGIILQKQKSQLNQVEAEAEAEEEEESHVVQTVWSWNNWIKRGHVLSSISCW